MPELNLSTLMGRSHQRSINFIKVKTDHVAAGLSKIINYGLIASVILTIITWCGLGYEFYLRRQLNAIGAQIDGVGQQVDQMINAPADQVGEDEIPIRFANKFIATQQKLARYEQLLDDEKMVDLFGILSAIVPEGVRISNLSIQPHFVEVTFFVSQGKNNDNLPIRQFAANLREVNNATFQDGKKLRIDETDISAITMAADQAGSSGNGYEMAVSFNYSITDPVSYELDG